MLFSIDVALEDGDEEALDREGRAHHGCESGHSRAHCWDGGGPTWLGGHYPDQEEQVPHNADDAIAHEMCSELEVFEDDAPNYEKAGID